MKKLLLLTAFAVSLNSTSIQAESYLSMAIKKASLLVTKAQLAVGFDAPSMLMRAVINNDVSTVAFLLDRGADVNAKYQTGTISGLTLLHVASAKKEYKAIVELLLAKGADVNAKVVGGLTPLKMASTQNNEEIMALLLANGADITFALQESTDVELADYLHCASSEGWVKVVEQLLTLGADVNAQDKDGYTPLHKAVQKGSKETAKLLLDRGANVRAKDKNGWTPFFEAFTQENFEIMHLLALDYGDVESGVQIAILSGQAGAEALLCASMHGLRDAVKQLLDSGVDVNTSCKKGYTALHGASQEGHKEVVEFLLAHGADIHAKDKAGKTARMRAQKEGHIEIAQLLEQHETKA